MRFGAGENLGGPDDADLRSARYAPKASRPKTPRGDPDAAERLAEELGEAIAPLLVDGSESAQERALRAAKAQERTAHEARKLAAAVLAGKVDPQAAQAAGRLLEQASKTFQTMAERLDAQKWAPRQAVPAIININSPVDGMNANQIAELLAEVRTVKGRRALISGDVS